MAILRDDDARFKHLERKIGTFVLVAVAGIILTLLAIGVRQELFTPKTRLHFVSDTGQDIHAGMAVKLSGFEIGKVEKLALTDNAKVRVTLSIKSEYMKWIKSDSKAQLTKEGVIGATIIELSPGSEAAVVLAQDSEIGFEHGGLGRVVDDLYRDLAPLIADIKRIARNADALIAGLPATQQNLDAVLTSAARNLQNLEKVTASDLPAISRSGRDTVEGAKKVVDSLSRTWPISGNIETPQPGLLPLDSYSSPRVPAEPKP